jgi:hypothetical protein
VEKSFDRDDKMPVELHPDFFERLAHRVAHNRAQCCGIISICHEFIVSLQQFDTNDTLFTYILSGWEWFPRYRT